jgi:serine phosphatase RsbU (regulator of sigma subunit)
VLRQWFASQKWRSRLILLSIVLTLAVLVGVTANIYLAYQQAASELVIERDRQVTYLSAGRLQNELAKISDELMTLARSPDLYRGDVTAQVETLQRASPRLVVFDGGVVLLDHLGKVRTTEPPRLDIIGDDWSDRDFFQGALTSPGIYFSDMTHDGPDQSMVVVTSVPVLDDRGEFAGALAGMFRLGEPTVSAFYAGIVRLRIGQTGNTYVVDSNGRILYDSGYNTVGQALDIPGLPLGALAGSGGALRTRDREGFDVVAAYAPIPGTKWTLVSEDDWGQLTSSTRRYARILLVLLGLGMVLPAAGVALLVREQNNERRERERVEQGDRVANLIQQTLLPKQVPMLPGWSLAAHYQPANTSGGDFYDFMILPDGRLMLVIGGVTERGVQAAHVMATARAALRGSARRALPPSAALEHSNEILCLETGPGSFVACLYGLLDPLNGTLELANAGYNVPVWHGNGRGAELPISGTPLGRFLETHYEQSEMVIQPRECLAFYSTGLTEANNPRGEPFGLSRLKGVLASHTGDSRMLIEAVVSAIREFTGQDWVPQDDVILLVLERTPEDQPVQAGSGNSHPA